MIVQSLSTLEIAAPDLFAPTTILLGDAVDQLADIRSGAVQTCVTSPPYYGLRDYGDPGQLGQERTPEEYVASILAVLREVRRTLANDGTLWLNIGDCYIRKSLQMLPSRVANALREDGWFLRSEVVWEKPNVCPESVTDRPTRSHEMVYLLSKSSRYFYDASAISEACTKGASGSTFTGGKTGITQLGRTSKLERVDHERRNARTVWSIPTQPFAEAHFACMPPVLADRCIRASSRPGDLVLDPFLGAGTTALAAMRTGRLAVGCELNEGYVDIAVRRLAREGFAASVF